MIPVPKTKLSVVLVKSKHRAVHTEAFLWNSQKQGREPNPWCDTAPLTDQGTEQRPKTGGHREQKWKILSW